MLKSKLQQIAEKAKIKSSFNEDTKKFANIVLENWLEKCSKAANEEEYSTVLLAFKADAVFENNKIRYFLKNGLLELIEKETTLKPSVHNYIINKENKAVEEISGDIPFEKLFYLDKEVLLHFYVIKLNWD